MNTTFEDRLLDELKHEVRRAATTEAPAAPRRRAITPARAGLGLATAAAAAAAFLLLPGGGASPAYAVERNEDGTVAFTYSEFREYDSEDIRNMVADLRAAGMTIVEEPEDVLVCGDGDRYHPLGPMDLARVDADGDMGPVDERVSFRIIQASSGLEQLPGTGQETGFLLEPGDTVVHDTNGDDDALAFFHGSCA
ncbi:hypothetical protein E1265_24325 [Streptomyces sp. 8K308]|uniref:hypothetical protein n=1 Tax=Streptomyces sp. 8K308 TaxID=2530388 RepID=UPI00104FBB21|nr:hypothetical protein [Streptomyces sp. 8K308]TDC19216.1 hypothetical protein E1265_24325 [Streptomyces sp. 8K308]